MKIDQKILHIAGGIYGTLSVVYGERYRHEAQKLFPQIISATNYIKSKLTLAGNEVIVLKPIKGRVTGLHFNLTNKIFVDPRQTLLKVMETIAHELVHAEQTFTGKLKTTGMMKGSRLWNNDFFPPPRNYNEYRNLPWEKEAFERQEELAKASLGIK